MAETQEPEETERVRLRRTDRHANWIAAGIGALAAILASAVGAFVTYHVTLDQTHVSEQIELDQVHAGQQQSVSTFIRAQREVAYTTIIRDSESLQNILTIYQGVPAFKRAQKSEALNQKVSNDVITIALVGSVPASVDAEHLADSAAYIIAEPPVSKKGFTAAQNRNFDNYAKALATMITQMRTDLQGSVQGST